MVAIVPGRAAVSLRAPELRAVLWENPTYGISGGALETWPTGARASALPDGGGLILWTLWITPRTGSHTRSPSDLGTRNCHLLPMSVTPPPVRAKISGVPYISTREANADGRTAARSLSLVGPDVRSRAMSCVKQSDQLSIMYAHHQPVDLWSTSAPVLCILSRC